MFFTRCHLSLRDYDDAYLVGSGANLISEPKVLAYFFPPSSNFEAGV